MIFHILFIVFENVDNNVAHVVDMLAIGFRRARVKKCHSRGEEENTFLTFYAKNRMTILNMQYFRGYKIE